MSTTDTEKHCRLCLMLNKGGTKACHSLLLHRVKELTPSKHLPQMWTVEEFLQSKQKEIRKSNITKEKYRVLFPSTGVTDMSKWDLSLFCSILTTYCELKHLTRLDVEQLRNIRNELCHMNEPSVDEKKYQDYFETIKVVVVRILEKINDCETKQATEKILDDIHRGPLSLVETLKEMHKFYSKETDIREKLECIQDAENRVLQKVEKFDEKLDLIVNRLDHEDSSKIHSARNNFLLPGVKIILDLKNVSQDEEHEMSTVLEQLFEEVINEDEDFKSTMPIESHTRLREAVRKTFKRFLSKGWRITGVKHECVQLYIRCSSFSCLAAIFREHIGGEINKELTDLKEAISECLGKEEAQLETVVYKDEFWSVMDKTVSVVDDLLNDYCSDTFPTVHRGLPPDTDEKKHTLTITARNVNHDGPQSFHEECANELDSCERLLETALGEEFSASHVSVQTRFTQKMPEKEKDKTEQSDKNAAPKRKETEKDLIDFPSSSGFSSDDMELLSHEFRSKTSASEDSSDKLQTIALLELHRSEISVALYLELALISADDYNPKFASKIRSASEMARNIHLETFFRRMYIHVRHIKSYLSVVLKVLYRDSTPYSPTLDTFLDDAIKLKDETLSLQRRYAELQDTISSDIKILEMLHKKEKVNVEDKILDLPSEKLADIERSKSKKGVYSSEESTSQFNMQRILCSSDMGEESSVSGIYKLPDKSTDVRTDENTGKFKMYSFLHVEEKGQRKTKYEAWRNEMADSMPPGVIDLDKHAYDTLLIKLRPGSALTGGKRWKEKDRLDIIRSFYLANWFNLWIPRKAEPFLFGHQSTYKEEFDKLKTIRSQEGDISIECLHQVCKHLTYIDDQLRRITDCWADFIAALGLLQGFNEASHLYTVLSKSDFDDKIEVLKQEWDVVFETFLEYEEGKGKFRFFYEFLSDTKPRHSVKRRQELLDIIERAITWTYLPPDTSK